MRERVDLVGLLKSNKPTYIAAPMVRYSKLPFRILCRRWGADIATTPMIIAESFNRSEQARDSDFSTSIASLASETPHDGPLVVQFGTRDPLELALAAAKAAPYVDGIDLNCGCPQRWAMQEGIGAALSAEPETVHDLVTAAVRAVDGIPVSIKIRLHRDMRRTMDLIKSAEMAGVSWITVHGRTAEQRTKIPVQLDQVKAICQTASVPIVENGDVFGPRDIDHIVQQTGVSGVMSARGLLANPALFSGYEDVPIQVCAEYLELALRLGGGDGDRFSIHHHHLMYMLFRHLSKAERTCFSYLCSMMGIVDFFYERRWLLCQLVEDGCLVREDTLTQNTSLH